MAVLIWLGMMAAILLTVAVIGRLGYGNWAGIPKEEDDE